MSLRAETFGERERDCLVDDGKRKEKNRDHGYSY